MDNTTDIIDSRDVIDRIEELHEIHTMTIAESLELSRLRSLAGQGVQYGEDWEYGCSIIRHSYFVEYIKNFVDEIDGIAIENAPEWMTQAIDWDKVAEYFSSDYTEIDYAGEVYYVRTRHGN